MKEEGNLILIRIVGSHFLWKLVRQIIGIIAEVGRGKLALENVKHFLSVQSSEPAKFTAPPSGLFLERVYYNGDARKKDLQSFISIPTFQK